MHIEHRFVIGNEVKSNISGKSISFVYEFAQKVFKKYWHRGLTKYETYNIHESIMVTRYCH